MQREAERDCASALMHRRRRWTIIFAHGYHSLFLDQTEVSWAGAAVAVMAGLALHVGALYNWVLKASSDV